jgi:AcrR family transcriptional regulator
VISLSGKQKLYDTFTNLIQKYSYNDITIKDIIREANVNRNTFYYHFMDMDSFLKEYLDDAVYFNMRSLLLVDYSETHRELMRNILDHPVTMDILVKI